jgi:hypothetical protein
VRYVTILVYVALAVFFGECWYQGNIRLGNMVALSASTFLIFPPFVRTIAAWSGSAFQFLLTEKRIRTQNPVVSVISGAFTVAGLIGPMAGYLILWGEPLTLAVGTKAAVLAVYSSWVSQHMCVYFVKEIICELKTFRAPKSSPASAMSSAEVWQSSSLPEF